MNRTVRAIVACILIGIIFFCAITIVQNISKTVRFDITEQKLYTLSDGTKSILNKLNQPIKIKLYYARTAAMQAPDQIKYFNNYYYFVKALLEEYVRQSNGMIKLEIIDPRPFSDEEVEALRHGIQRFMITEEESFFFGMLLQTQFGVDKTISFFSPDRQNFIEYDISYLVDTATTRQKKRIGVLSSLPVTGENLSPYMMQMMRMQGQQPKKPWTIVEQLKQQYEITSIPTDANDINDIDMLLVIHPKNLPETTRFAIDQWVLKGQRTIVCIDPHCLSDKPDPRTQQYQMPSQSSNLRTLLNAWGLEMPENTFAGDRRLALSASLRQNQRPETIIGFLELISPWCFNPDMVITAELNKVRMLFSGILKQTDSENEYQYTPLITTTDQGNSWKIDNPYELMMMDSSRLMNKFMDGSEPVNMGYMVTGRFKSAFPEGIEIQLPSDSNDPNAPPATKQITGLTQAQQDCTVVVLADVDFISDMVAYQNSFFGTTIVGDNSALLLNIIDDLGGSSDLISIRSRGNFERRFTLIDDIEAQAEQDTAAEEARINAEIAGFQQELQEIISSAQQGQQQIIGSSIIRKKADLEYKIRQAQKQLRYVKMQERKKIERKGNILRNINMLLAPIVILIIVVILGTRRSIKRRYYISHPIAEN